MEKNITYTGIVNSIGRRPDVVIQCLESFFNQAIPPQKVIFLNQNQVPIELPELLQSKPIEQVMINAPTPSKARNQLPKSISTEWLCFIDDDGVLAPSYSAELQKIISKNPHLDLIAGTVKNNTDGAYYTIRLQLGGRLDSLHGSKLFMGGNFLIRHHIFDELGRYDERFGTGGRWSSSEETDLCWKAIAAGKRMLYARELVVLHPPVHQGNSQIAAQKAYRYGLGKGAMVAKWIFERPSTLGFYEFFEMNVIPWVNSARGLIRGEWGQVRIQAAAFAGRWVGFFEFIFFKMRGKPSLRRHQ